MPELPTGTVTFLFTDIEGSTRLLQELGSGYRSVQDQHAEIIRRSITEAGGTEVRTEGDSFFAAFITPGDAVRAAVAAQRDLASHPWPPGQPLRVRMGLHTGEGVLGGGDYLGLDVNRAARIAAAASGGQILLSEATAVLAQHALPRGVTIRSLGHHRLKDFGLPEHLHDLVIAGLPSRFPPPRSLEVPSNLPTELTSFIGRDAEVERAKALLTRTRQLTVTGPGGTGKTRLALRIATDISPQFPDGTFFVDLAPLSDSALVIPTIASTLGLREEGWEKPVRDNLDDHLRQRRLLLLLDNFEHLLDAAPVVTQLLETAPALTVVVTSRSPLHLRSEQDLPLHPLPLPPNATSALQALARNEAVALFVERARAVAPDFALTPDNGPQVAEIVARLDGLPLAIELAAMRSAVLPPGLMLEQMERRLPLLSKGARDLPRRQQTLRATVAWSHDLLENDERILFRQLSVLRGGFSLAAAASVGDPHGDLAIDILDLLSSLADSSLVHAPGASQETIRFGMLQTIREFAHEQLEAAGERPATEHRHAAWFLGLAEEAEPHLRGPELAHWMVALQLDHDNLRAALSWAIEKDEAEIGLRLVGALWRFWHLGGHLSEGRRWASAVLSLPSAKPRTSARAKALTALGGLAYWQNDVPAVRSVYEEALAISREIGDEAAVAEGTYNLGFAYGLVPTRAGSRELFLASRQMFERLGNRRGVADSLWALALLDGLKGNHVIARTQAEASVRLHREVGDAFGLVDSLHVLGRAAFELEDLEVARSIHLETLRFLEPVGYRTAIAEALDHLAAHENKLGHATRAMRLGGASEALKESAGSQVPPEFNDLPDPHVAARATLDDEEIASAWEEGRAMTLPEAVALARAEPKTEEP